MKKTMMIKMDCDKIHIEELERAATILRKGGTVAFPTETVYGLGANGLDVAAVEKIFKAKGRPSDNPLILHISKHEDVKALAREVSEDAFRVMNTFWPGPLTVVLNKKEIVPSVITAGLTTVAIRMPAHPIARGLIQLAGVPLAAPSANISGKPSPTTAEHVVQDLDGRVDAIILGGSCNVGVESTVLDMTGEVPTILRPGGVTKEMLLQVLKKVETDGALLGEQDAAPRSPGMKYIHYAPKAAVYVVKGEGGQAVEKIKELVSAYIAEGKEVGIICFDESYQQYQEGQVKSIGSRRQLQMVAANLFKVLREFDETKVEIILAEAVEEENLGQAIMNRLMKAAGYRVINAK